MKAIILPRVVYEDTIDTKTYQEIYFGNMLSTTADVETLTAWDSLKADYQYLDEVYIDALKTKYTATVNNPTGHPSTSAGWFAEGINENRLLDSLYTSQTVFTASAEVEFNIIGMTHIVGQNIDNVKDVTVIFYRHDGTEISTVFDCDKCITPETSIVMAYYESFDCDSCCNPDAIYNTSFFLRLNPLSCNDVGKAKIIFSKVDDLNPVRIGVLATGKSHDLGCAQEGMSLEYNIPNNVVDFPEIKQTGILVANIETSIRGKTLIERKHVDRLRNLLARHGAYLNFYVFDEVDDITSGVILGRFTRFATTIENRDKVNLPIEIVGVQN